MKSIVAKSRCNKLKFFISAAGCVGTLFVSPLALAQDVQPHAGLVSQLLGAVGAVPLVAAQGDLNSIVNPRTGDLEGGMGWVPVPSVAMGALFRTSVRPGVGELAYVGVASFATRNIGTVLVEFQAGTGAVRLRGELLGTLPIQLYCSPAFIGRPNGARAMGIRLAIEPLNARATAAWEDQIRDSRVMWNPEFVVALAAYTSLGGSAVLTVNARAGAGVGLGGVQDGRPMTGAAMATMRLRSTVTLMFGGYGDESVIDNAIQFSGNVEYTPSFSPSITDGTLWEARLSYLRRFGTTSVGLGPYYRRQNLNTNNLVAATPAEQHLAPHEVGALLGFTF